MGYIKLKEKVKSHAFVLNIMKADLLMANIGGREKTKVVLEIHTGHSGLHVL